jgi:hypothetical protein
MHKRLQLIDKLKLKLKYKNQKLKKSRNQRIYCLEKFIYWYPIL